MRRDRLERHQVWAYVLAIAVGLVVGRGAPAAGPLLEVVVWPLLAMLLFATFTQLPLGRLGAALRDRRFVAAMLLGNFVAVPLVVWALLPLVPADPALRLGVVLVLVVPCTDWFVTFTHLAGGDARRAVAATPLLLLAQFALLPLWVRLLVGEAVVAAVPLGSAVVAFLALIVVPLLAAGALQRAAARRRGAAVAIERLAWAPVPLLALVLGSVAASQVAVVEAVAAQLVPLAGVYVAYLVVAVAVGVVVSRLFAVPMAAARTVVFSLASRNSFVVLPLALALPAQWRAAAVAVAFQSLIELFGLVVLVAVVPRLLGGGSGRG